MIFLFSCLPFLSSLGELLSAARDDVEEEKTFTFYDAFGEMQDENGLQEKLIETRLRKKTSPLYGLWFMIGRKINSPAAHIFCFAFLREFLLEKRAKSRSTPARECRRNAPKNYY